MQTRFKNSDQVGRFQGKLLRRLMLWIPGNLNSMQLNPIFTYNASGVFILFSFGKYFKTKLE